MWRTTSEAHTDITDNVTTRECTVNLNHPDTTYDLAVQHGHDLTDAAERRRQTHRFQRWMNGNRQAGTGSPRGSGAAVTAGR